MSANHLPPEAVTLTIHASGSIVTMDASDAGRAAIRAVLAAMAPPPPSPAAQARQARVREIGASAVLAEELDRLAVIRGRA